MQLVVTLALALTLAGPSPEGKWKTIDDETKKPRSIVKITESGVGVLTGTIIHIYPILDPENGKTYKCFIELEDGGAKIKLRGFVGGPLLGRTQYWYRLDQ